MKAGPTQMRDRGRQFESMNRQRDNDSHQPLDRERVLRSLEAKRNELCQGIPERHTLEVCRSADDIEVLVSLRNADIAARAIDTDYLTRKAVDEALRRVRNGCYGECEECGGPIHPKRLKAIPWAALCIECQDHQDRQVA